MKFVSTRQNITVSGAQAIVEGISSDGGLFVPQSFPQVSLNEISEFCEMEYPQIASRIMSKYFDEFSEDEIRGFCQKAYSRFDGEETCPVVKIDDGLFALELWHGPTAAFKDVALTLLPMLLSASKKKLGKNDKTLILTATSGDTGKAALEGFKDADGVYIIVFYPEGGVSEMQKIQMATQDGANVAVCGIRGNFDDAQTAVKKVFTDKEFAKKLSQKNISMSSANSINIGRLIPQVAYYFSAYADLAASGEIQMGDKINFVVPTGNFGNILAAYYAYRMGLPVGRLILASNSNNILSDFFHTGEYDVKRKFYKTISPSMDILISSNLERYLFEVLGRDCEKVMELFAALSKDKKFVLNQKDLSGGIFEAAWADEEETKEAIFNFYDLYDYVLDPHTAVAASIYTDYVDETCDGTPTVLVSTASPFKFAPDVYNAFNMGYVKDPFRAVNLLEIATALEVPACLKGLKEKPVRHRLIIDADKIAGAVEAIVGNFFEKNGGEA
jgi:threonine synthase